MLHDGFVVRRANETDVAELELLESLARSRLVESRGGPQWLEEHPQSDWPSAVSDGFVGLALVDDVPVGFLEMAKPDGRGVARVVQVFVLPEAREVGFGDILFSEALAWARSMGAVAVEGEALPGDRDTKNLYERAGVTARKIIVYKRLDQGEQA